MCDKTMIVQTRFDDRELCFKRNLDQGAAAIRCQATRSEFCEVNKRADVRLSGFAKARHSNKRRTL